MVSPWKKTVTPILAMEVTKAVTPTVTVIVTKTVILTVTVTITKTVTEALREKNTVNASTSIYIISDYCC